MDLIDLFLALKMGFSFKTKMGVYKYSGFENEPEWLDEVLDSVLQNHK